MKNTEGVPYGRGLEVPESSVLSVVLILLAIANIVTNYIKAGGRVKSIFAPASLILLHRSDFSQKIVFRLK